MREITLRGQRVALYALDTVVVGSGCAGFNAADTLFDLGRRDIALLTEGVNMGTSRNTGSDKQTYYKLSLCADAQDSVYQLAENLFAGGSVNGDTALAEAAGSVRSFMKLVNLGVPFPTNRYGEYVGYKTDHDPRQRATSCGPLTSKVMTEKLESSVRQKGIPLLDGFQAVRLLVEEGRVAGLVALDKSRLSQEDWGLAVFLCGQVVLATGGPAIAYGRTVYPPQPDGLHRPGPGGRRRRMQPAGVAVRPGLCKVPLERLRHLPAGAAPVHLRGRGGPGAGVPGGSLGGPAGIGAGVPQGLPVAR